MNKEELLNHISSSLDLMSIRDWTEWPSHTGALYLQYNVDGWNYISEKYGLKWGDTVTQEQIDEIMMFVWKKFQDFYEQTKDKMSWNK